MSVSKLFLSALAERRGCGRTSATELTIYLGGASTVVCPLVRWVVGLVLVGAAMFKAAELLTAPATALVTPFGRWLVPLEVGAELGIGVVALSGLYWRQLRPVALALFVGFAGYSLYLALTGATSCGCFGPITVHPRWTFSLDIAVVAGLAMSINTRGLSQFFRVREKKWDCPAPHKRFLTPFSVAALSVSIISTAFLVRHLSQHAATAGDLTTADGLVILEPETWVGKKLPIIDYSDLDLTTGQWIVLLHRHDCPDCQEAVPHYEQLAAMGENVALIEVPPFGESPPAASASHHGRLQADYEWFVQTPVEIQLQDGLVAAVKMHDDDRNRWGVAGHHRADGRAAGTIVAMVAGKIVPIPLLLRLMASFSSLMAVVASKVRVLLSQGAPLFVAGCFCWVAVSSLFIYPHSLAYFNESIGGPINGHHHLLGSSFDWGQDDHYVMVALRELYRRPTLWTNDHYRRIKAQFPSVLIIDPEMVCRPDKRSRDRFARSFDSATPLTYARRWDGLVD